VLAKALLAAEQEECASCPTPCGYKQGDQKVC
jgi:hypothetical protein